MENRVAQAPELPSGQLWAGILKKMSSGRLWAGILKKMSLGQLWAGIFKKIDIKLDVDFFVLGDLFTMLTL